MHLILFDDEHSEIDLKEEIIMELVSDVHAYEEEVFVEKLLDKLVRRDMILKYGVVKVNKMDYREIINKEDEFRTRYFDSFERYGLNKLVLKK